MSSSSLLIDEPPLQVLPKLAVAVGLNRAVFVQQLHYWLSKPGAHERDGRRWVYNTYDEWAEQFPFWTVQTIRKRIVNPLEELGVVITTDQYNRMSSDKTKWYTIDYEKLEQLLTAPDKTTDPTLNPPDKTTTATGQNDHTRTGQNDHSVNQRLPETTNRDSSLQADDRPEEAGPSANPKPISSKQYAVRRLAEKVKHAKEEKKNPTPPDENFKRRFASVYEAYLRDGYEPWQLEKPMDYMVECACGQGVGWLQGKRRWIPLVDAIAHVEGDDRATTNETPNPASDAAMAAKDKPRAPMWYASMFERANYGELEALIKAGCTHTQIVEELEKGDSGAA